MAIYQKARPVLWSEVVGQEHVRNVLQVALEKGRIGHAYLFSGPRGVGKTTTARLIAMTVNCETPGIKPCGTCSSCQLVQHGAHPDVIEIDAASNNSVDDVRDLREKVGLAAMRGGKKVYILDEAHMMSRGAFNALLKTLEEPPEHVIFILATTEPEKILPTILSRCQHYRFRRLSEAEIASKLEKLCHKENVTFEPEALQLIGRLADGAMRDGESLLERMLASGEAVTLKAVEDALGLPAGERMYSLASALLAGDAQTVLHLAGELYREGFAARTVVEQSKVALRNMLHAELQQKSGQMDVGSALVLLARLDEQDSRFSRSADLLALEMALTHALVGSGSTVSGSAGADNIPADVGRRISTLENELRQIKNRSVASGNAPVVQSQSRAAEPTTITAPPSNGSWQDVLRLASAQMRAFMKPAQTEWQDGVLYISITSKFHGTQVMQKFDELSKMISEVFGDVDFVLQTPEASKKKLGTAKSSVTLPETTAPTPSPPVPKIPEPTLSRSTQQAQDFFSEAKKPEPVKTVSAAEFFDAEPISSIPEFDTPPLETYSLPPQSFAPTPKPEDFFSPPVIPPPSNKKAHSIQEHPLYQDFVSMFNAKPREFGVLRRKPLQEESAEPEPASDDPETENT